MLQLSEKMNRLGTETAFEVLARAEALAREGRDIINLGIGQPDFKTPPHVVEAAIKALHDGHHGYTPSPGILPLRESVAADLHRRRGVEISPDRIVVVPGGKVTMFFAILMFGEPGVEILYPNPGFPIYESVIQFSGATAVPTPLLEDRDFSFDAGAVLDQVTADTRLLILNSPANPTGGAMPRDEIDKLVKGLVDHPQVAVLSDEIYSRISYDGREHVSLLDYPEIADRLILLDGWSKTYAMTGWRMGYAVWPAALVEGATRLAVNCHSCVNAATQYAGIAALDGHQDAVDDMVRAFEERRRVIVDGLNAIPGFRCRTPGGAFYAFPNVQGTGLDARSLQRRLLEEAGVATVAGTSFGHLGEGFIRFSYANSIDNIQEALKRIRTLLLD
ncbi:MAG: pyridoxal phosphate-dependent aminotransferase [Pseudomonadota bacterium]|jgi:aspartate/methionine/tyrosine aminotransferase|uniref:Aminotransferase class I/classII large domain-containing protein n=1 Tax=marine metagenome TaxID=408172 RepID=A0A381VZT1_9ZZZZ|nr:pyridoxal phosphate-dependent aminotransferase [Pseudomonadota bacterium]MEC8872208.1 pyridoxal phosphate-dependent aminotransferase [Pseudomonadota bacterium]MEE3281514.1 pyridoxal phosphate-dependent aminotransferase [Pseudomonadota bacterium]MEE3291533.1 pyridoxal phosphate-dependent aminotransferase [Pseudomonadota bacterium]|tara:strand:- start:153 stop:1322 length:1170 start_codon:yes stop_codon:yes gene_type:complete